MLSVFNALILAGSCASSIFLYHQFWIKRSYHLFAKTETLPYEIIRHQVRQKKWNGEFRLLILQNGKGPFWTQWRGFRVHSTKESLVAKILEICNILKWDAGSRDWVALGNSSQSSLEYGIREYFRSLEKSKNLIASTQITAQDLKVEGNADSYRLTLPNGKSRIAFITSKFDKKPTIYWVDDGTKVEDYVVEAIENYNHERALMEKREEISRHWMERSQGVR